MTNPAASPRVLLVEGVDDKHVIMHLCLRNGITEFDIVDKGNIDQVLRAIEPEVKAPNRQAVGIIVDADDRWQDRWRAVTNQLRKANVASPREPVPAGTIIEGTPRIGVWLMPNNMSSGELEDFVAAMIPKGDPVWPLSEAYVDDIPVADRKFKPGKTLRAKVHSWLATREEPRTNGLRCQSARLRRNRAIRCDSGGLAPGSIRLSRSVSALLPTICCG